jgi:hypothetical protein
MRWESFAMMENFSSALGVNGYPGMPAKHDDMIDDEETNGNAQMKAKKANMRAVTYSTMAMKSFRFMAVISKSKNVDLPGRLA